MSDAEVITSALTASLFFYGNHQLACNYLKEHGLIPKMLSKSRFNRRLHAVAKLLSDLQQQLGMALKEINYSTDLFPFPLAIIFELKDVVCFNQRIIEVTSHPKNVISME